MSRIICTTAILSAYDYDKPVFFTLTAADRAIETRKLVKWSPTLSVCLSVCIVVYCVETLNILSYFSLQSILILVLHQLYCGSISIWDVTFNSLHGANEGS